MMKLVKRLCIIMVLGVFFSSLSEAKISPIYKLDCRLQSLTGNTEFTSFRPQMLQKASWLKNDQVKVEVRLNVPAENVLGQLKAAGLNIAAHYQGLVSGTITKDKLIGLAALDFVSTVSPIFRPIRTSPSINITNQIQSGDEGDSPFPYTGEGVASLRADVVQNNMPGFDGTGVKVGVISDSFGRASESTPVYADVNEDGIDDIVGTDSQWLQELPLTVGILEDAFVEYDEEGNPDDFYSDEGRAMAEIVHEMAPGAELFFHAAFNDGKPGTARAIEKLADAGCSVITDDTFYLNEPMFQDGEIAQAIDQVSNASDVVFITASGNLNVNSVYSQYYDIDPENNNDEWSKIPNEVDFHNWDRTFGATEYLPVTLLPGSSLTVTLHWENPFSGMLGEGASTDFDMYLFDTDYNLLYAADNVQGTTASPSGDPWEIAGYGNYSDDFEPKTILIAIDKHHGPAVPFKLVVFGNNDAIKISSTRFDQPILFGRNLAKTAVSVGAVNVFENDSDGELLDDPHIVDPTIYSSKGGYHRILYSPTGERLPEPELFFSPQVSSVDGTNNSFFGGYGSDGDELPNFFGTSAASPHVAGIAAMVRQANPDLTGAEVRQLFSDTAVDVFEPGLDAYTGYGMVYADLAVQAALDKIAQTDPVQTPVIIQSPTPRPATPTPTMTPIPTATPLVPVEGVIITDNTNTYQDLSGGLDLDAADKRELVVRWNFDMTDIADVHVYISINGEENVYLGRTGSNEETKFVWKENGALTQAPYKNGPQAVNTYSFSIYLITESGEPHHYGPYETGTVYYFVNE
jgi:hypothetical protein